MMKKEIKWDISLETGVEEIDKQHKYFIKILNEINDAILRNSRDGALEALHFMDRYARWHFGTEEKYMKKYGYPDFEKHRAEHKKFYENTRRMLQHAREKGIDNIFAFSINKYLIDWLILHIKGEDKKFAEFLRNNKLVVEKEKLPDSFEKLEKT